MKVFRKRITEIEIPLVDKDGKDIYLTTKEIIDVVKKTTLTDKLISDTYHVEDDIGITLNKEKVEPAIATEIIITPTTPKVVIGK